MMDSESVMVVSGLPRSGTSMMMKMLAAGGIAVVTDNIRRADEDNPKGYYEFEKVKALEQDSSWLSDARGKVVKVISALLKHLPADYPYKVVFMRRRMDEILASQREMLIRRGEAADATSDERMAELFRKHLGEVEAWLAAQPNIEVVYVDYNGVMTDPQEWIDKANEFLGGGLDTVRMREAVDAALYRQRK
jgi:Sulfotransferase domain